MGALNFPGVCWLCWLTVYVIKKQNSSRKWPTLKSNISKFVATAGEKGHLIKANNKAAVRAVFESVAKMMASAGISEDLFHERERAEGGGGSGVGSVESITVCTPPVCQGHNPWYPHSGRVMTLLDTAWKSRAPLKISSCRNSALTTVDFQSR